MGRVHLGQESLFLNSGSKAISSRNKGVGYVNQFFDRAVKKKIAQPESSLYSPSVASLSDGTIVAAFGTEGLRLADGTTTTSLVKIAPDMSMSDITVVDLLGWSLNVEVDSLDRILVTGASPSLVRYSSSGTADTSFNSNASSAFPNPGGIQHLAVDSLDGVFIAGFQDMANGSPEETFKRLHENGVEDTTFNDRLGYDPLSAQNECWHVSVSPLDGSVIVAGTFVSVDSTSTNNGIARFHANGVFDSSFSPFVSEDGSNVYSTRTDHTTGKVYIAGSFTSVGAAIDRYYLARLHPNGAVDTSFPDVGLSSGAYIRHIEPLSDGGVMIAGNFETAGNSITSVPAEDRRVRVAAFNSDGTPRRFNLNMPNDNLLVQQGVAREIVPVSDGSYLISGSTIVEMDGTSTPLGFAKINKKNLVDPTFEFPSAVGGSVSEFSYWRVHTFTASDDLVFDRGGGIEYLLVGGGGSGLNRTNDTGGGGGGAAGYLSSTMSISAGTYPVVVGAGGAALPAGQTGGNSGTSSIFAGLEAFRGSHTVSAGPETVGSGAGEVGSATLQSFGTTTTGQGNDGGPAYNDGSDTGNRAGGGGGGAGSVGGTASIKLGGFGGSGVTSLITGTPVGYAGGGGGGATNGTGGSASHGGGAGASGTNSASDAVDGTGGGGGSTGNGGQAGSGGDGVVIVRYLVR